MTIYPASVLKYVCYFPCVCFFSIPCVCVWIFACLGQCIFAYIKYKTVWNRIKHYLPTFESNTNASDDFKYFWYLPTIYLLCYTAPSFFASFISFCALPFSFSTAICTLLSSQRIQFYYNSAQKSSIKFNSATCNVLHPNKPSHI